MTLRFRACEVLPDLGQPFPNLIREGLPTIHSETSTVVHKSLHVKVYYSDGDQLLSDARRGKFDRVVVWAFDRMARLVNSAASLRASL